jgi:hypothetical protein
MPCPTRSPRDIVKSKLTDTPSGPNAPTSEPPAASVGYIFFTMKSDYMTSFTLVRMLNRPAHSMTSRRMTLDPRSLCPGVANLAIVQPRSGIVSESLS